MEGCALSLEIGKKYNRLLIIGEKEYYYNEANNKCWRVPVRCDCGKELFVRVGNLKQGRSKSCGCLKFEVNKIHGMNKTRFRQCYKQMKQRCRRDKNYTDNGITVCEKWNTFLGFKEDMFDSYKEDLTLDRINNSEGYFKENCRWADYSVQNHNKGVKSKLGIRGVCETAHNKYVVHITNGIMVYLGTYYDVNFAAQVFDEASEIIYGDRPNKTTPVDGDTSKNIYSILAMKAHKMIKTAYQLGVRGYKLGHQIHDCPFANGTDEEYEWCCGWRDSEFSYDNNNNYEDV